MRRGEENPRAVLTDEEVDMIRELFEEDRDKPRGERYWTYDRLSEKFEVSRRHIANIVGYHQRVPEE